MNGTNQPEPLRPLTKENWLRIAEAIRYMPDSDLGRINFAKNIADDLYRLCADFDYAAFIFAVRGAP